MITRCYLEITNVCNLSCVFCPKTERAKHTLTLDEFDALTSRLEGKVKFLYFHLMGEPFLHPLLPQFVLMARHKGFVPIITTNGTLLSRRADLLDALPHKIQISLHFDHNGDIQLGNLFSQSLADILASPRARALYDGFTSHTAVESLCQRCGYSAVSKRFRK